MDDALKSATERLAQVRDKIAALRNQIRDAQSLLARHEEEAGSLDTWIAKWYELSGIQPPRGPEQKEAEPTHAPRRPMNPPRSFVADEAIRVIQERGAPMPRKELFDALAERGVEIRGKDPEMVLSTMLWREPEKIVRLPQLGYWPAKVSYPDAGYVVFEGVDLLDAAAKEPEGGTEADDVDDGSDELPLNEGRDLA